MLSNESLEFKVKMFVNFVLKKIVFIFKVLQNSEANIVALIHKFESLHLFQDKADSFFTTQRLNYISNQTEQLKPRVTELRNVDLVEVTSAVKALETSSKNLLRSVSIKSYYLKVMSFANKNYENCHVRLGRVCSHR